MNPEDKATLPITFAPKDGSWCWIKNPAGWWRARYGVTWMGTAWHNGNLIIADATHWRPLSNPEPERTSDEPCAPTTTDTPTPSSLSASSATLGTSNPSELVATVGGTPRTDKERTWQITDPFASDVKEAVNKDFARALETELLATSAEVERLKTQLSSIILDSAPASPEWLAKAAQREDALTIAELRKEGSET